MLTFGQSHPLKAFTSFRVHVAVRNMPFGRIKKGPNMRFRIVNYQVKYNNDTLTTPMPFDMTEQLALYIELKYGFKFSIVRAEESDDDRWIVGHFVPREQEVYQDETSTIYPDGSMDLEGEHFTPEQTAEMIGLPAMASEWEVE